MKPTIEQTNARAREAGLFEGADEIVHAAMTLAYEAGRKDENEACAKMIETSDLGELTYDPNMQHWIAALLMGYVTAIRARREQ